VAESDEPDPRVAELERQVRELDRRVRSSAQDAAAARVLAGGADRDVAEIRDFRQATTSSFNAMRADFTDLRRECTELQQRVDEASPRCAASSTRPRPVSNTSSTC
jgi:sirohydrochlorin ferrochelatase